jgi:hypothetical protein
MQRAHRQAHRVLRAGLPRRRVARSNRSRVCPRSYSHSHVHRGAVSLAYSALLSRSQLSVRSAMSLSSSLLRREREEEELVRDTPYSTARRHQRRRSTLAQRGMRARVECQHHTQLISGTRVRLCARAPACPLLCSSARVQHLSHTSSPFRAKNLSPIQSKYRDSEGNDIPIYRYAFDASEARMRMRIRMGAETLRPRTHFATSSRFDPPLNVKPY